MSATTKVTPASPPHIQMAKIKVSGKKSRSLSIEASFLLTFDIFNKTHVLAFRDVDKHDGGVSQEARKKSHIRKFFSCLLPCHLSSFVRKVVLKGRLKYLNRLMTISGNMKLGQVR